ncbi:MAG: hypothetical protein J0H12_05760 [Candidatus Paracaedimonas acanthamoebae]|uniref:Uncharacterized protein n=1 Tax=Candidatus Paracaedimonas acanthamoebae TaxID=244581 RepID=A0A8J7TTZ6_9PROT|nr:hypothetical protein [Candidatus Paracaedimonas acanthamoebae]
MKKNSVSLLALMIGLGSSMNLHADALDKWNKLKLNNGASPANSSTGTGSKQQQTSTQDPKTKEHIAKLEAEISKLRALVAQGGKGTLTVDPELEKKVAQETEAYIQKITQEIEIAGKTVDKNEFQNLLEKIEEIGSIQLLLHLEEKFIKLAYQTSNANKLDDILSMLEGSEVLRKLHAQQQKLYFDNLAKAGQQRLQELKTLIKADLTYIKKSPPTLMLFMDVRKINSAVVQNNLGVFAKMYEIIPQADLQAIFSHLSEIKVNPQGTSSSSELMKRINTYIKPQEKKGRELTEKEFTSFYKKEDNQRGFQILIKNIADQEIQKRLYKLFDIENIESTKSGLTDDASKISASDEIAEMNLGSIKERQASLAAASAKSAQKKSEKTGAEVPPPPPPHIAGPVVPPPPPPPMKKGKTETEEPAKIPAKVYAIGEEISFDPKKSDTFKDEILATIQGREEQIEAEVDKNKNNAKIIKDKLAEFKSGLNLNNEKVLAAAYAISTAPAGTTKDNIKKRITAIIKPTMLQQVALVSFFKQASLS